MNEELKGQRTQKQTLPIRQLTGRLRRSIIGSKQGSNNIGSQMNNLFKVFIIISIFMYIIIISFSSYEGMLGIYIWLIISLIPMIVAAFHYTYEKKKEIDIQTGKTILKKLTFLTPLINFLPNLGCLIPLIIIVIVFVKIKSIINNPEITLPSEFTLYNHLTFFIIMLLFFLTNKFYSTLDFVTTEKTKNLISAGIFLFSTLAIFTSIKLYIISLSFITDG